jgi:hypothetical protein
VYLAVFCDSILIVFKRERQEKFRVSNGLHENSSNRQKLAVLKKTFIA